MVMTESASLDSGTGKAILDALTRLEAGMKQLQVDVNDVKAEVSAVKTTNELVAETLVEWRPQLSNEVKAVHQKLDAAEKR